MKGSYWEYLFHTEKTSVAQRKESEAGSWVDGRCAVLLQALRNLTCFCSYPVPNSCPKGETVTSQARVQKWKNSIAELL